MILDLEALTVRARERRRLPSPGERGAIRRGAGVTQAELAVVVGVSRALLAMWEIGQREPRGDALHRYLDALNALREATLP